MDAYPGYNALLGLGTIIAAYCWAHARRKLIEAADSDEARSQIAVGFIGRLYGIEREIAGQSPKRKKRVRRLPAHREFYFGSTRGLH